VSIAEIIDPKYGSSASVDSGFSVGSSSGDLKTGKIQILIPKRMTIALLIYTGISGDGNAFVRILKRHKTSSKEFLTRQNGSIIDDETIVKTMTQVDTVLSCSSENALISNQLKKAI